jgi:hypothetical protein
MTDVSGGEVLVYQDPGGRVRVDVLRRDQPSMPSVMHHAAIDMAGFMIAAFSEAVVEGDPLAWPESRGCSVEHGPRFAGDREAH